MIQRLELVQGTPAWHDFRSLGIGSSEVGTILGLNPYETADDLFLIKTKQVPPKDLSNNFHVTRGQSLEPKAREILNEKLNLVFKPATFIMPNFEFCRYSSDGITDDNLSICEIKAPAAKNHQKCIDLKGPIDYWYPQCQYGMMITGAKVCYFASYNQSFPDPLVYYPVFADKYFQAHLLNEVAKFWKAVQETQIF